MSLLVDLIVAGAIWLAIASVLIVAWALAGRRR